MRKKPEPLNPGEQEKVVALFNVARYVELEVLASRLLKAHPEEGFLWQALGVAQALQGKDALAALKKAARYLPGDPQAQSNLGSALSDAGRHVEAEASCRRALALFPEYADAHTNLGRALRGQGKLEAAATSYRRALELDPQSVETYNNLGNVLKELGQFEPAEEHYRQALALAPDYAEAHNNLGGVLKERGRLEAAETHCRRALALRPDYSEAFVTLGLILNERKQHVAALEACRRALTLSPESAEGHNALGVVLAENGQWEKAQAQYLRALELQPNYAEAYSNLGNALSNLGKIDEALVIYRRALELRPDYVEAVSNYLFCLSHSVTVDSGTLFKAHQEFGARLAAACSGRTEKNSVLHDKTRRLNIGVVSGDLCNHAVANFVLPVLEAFSGKEAWCLHAYYNHTVNDATTARLRACFTQWNDVSGVLDEALAAQIRADGIDILVDLSGHTARHRLLVFARKPAPIQVTWIGYPATTGLEAMDYFLADKSFLPPGRFDDQFTEKIAYLPACAPFLPSEESPEVNELPALRSGNLTFGSFNRMNKLSPQVIRLWSALLRALPGSRLLMGGLPQDGASETLKDWFAHEGIDIDRLVFHPRRGMKAYLLLHHQVDICLDAYPYNGGTTTLHALWMGVPTLTLRGQTPPSWVGASLQTLVGLESFVAETPAEFVERGLCWSGQIESLAEIRRTLRSRFQQSALGQPEVIAGALQQAFRTMWARWCDGLPAAVIDVSGEARVPEKEGI